MEDPRTEGSRPGFPAPPVKVVVADDNADLCGVLAVLLDSEPGFSCAGTVQDPRGIIEQIRAMEGHLLLLDVDLRGVSGFDLLVECRRELPGLKIVMLSGHDQPALVQRALELGAADYLIKPADLENLGERLRRVMSAPSDARPGS